MMLSFLIPFRNNAPTLKACLESLPVNSEVLAWDDHSTDGSREIAESFGATVFSSEQRISLGEMRENLFKRSKGEVIVFQDADDYRVTAKTMIALNYVQPGHLLMTPIMRVSGTERKYVYMFGCPFKDVFEMTFQTCGMYWHRDLLEQIEFTRQHCWEYDMFYKVMCRDITLIDYLHGSVSALYFGPGLYSATNRRGQLETRIALNRAIMNRFALSAEDYNMAVRSCETAEKLIEMTHEDTRCTFCFTKPADRDNGRRCLPDCYYHG